MSKLLYPRILTGLVWICLLAACNLPTGQVPPAGTETPLATLNPTEMVTPLPSPTEPLPSLTPTPEYAPVCDPEAASLPTPAGCQVPIAEQSSIFCTNKVPYNLILINAGAMYEVLSEGFECEDAGMKDGKGLVACTGLMATSFQLRVCDPACAIPTVQAEITQCPQDYVYDSLQGCCTQELQASAESCIVLDLMTRSCVVDCSEFTKESACDKHSYACEWNAANKVCQLRQ